MKNTDDLMNELKEKNCEVNRYLQNNQSSFINFSISDFWEKACKKSGLSKSNIINKSDFSYCYFYDVINGRKTPGKDKIVRLILSMGLDLDDCQQALRISGKSALYPRIKRDSIIIYAINNGFSVIKCSEMLLNCGEEALK